jgi:hypothetical protein
VKLAGFFAWLFAVLLAVLVSACGDSEKDMNTFKESKFFADHDIPESQFNLGCCYRDGIGVAKNPALAAKWYRKSADQGYAPAQNSLALLYRDGVGVVKDPIEAASLLRKAADQGYSKAHHNIAFLYRDGVGVAKDQVEAYAYLNLAGIVEEVSREWRDKLEDKMTPEAVLRGEQRTKELQKEIDARKAAKKAEDVKKAGK